ncbi:MAG: c-type cytochrome [Microthrixaceae bacterium]
MTGDFLPRSVRLAVVVVVGSVVLASCGGGGEPPAADLSAEAARGLEVAKRFNCTGCHTSDGSGSVGPTWKGLYGSDVELADGEKVTADDEYMRSSIEDPSAQVVKGFRSTMPEQDLTASQLDDVIAYIRELGD